MISKREKIILITVLLALLYSLYAIFIQSPNRSVSTKKTTDANTLVTETKGELGKGTEMELVDHMVSQAESPWKKDPFVGKRFFLSKLLNQEDPDEKGKPGNTDKREQTKAFAYTGYLDMGARKLAVINDIEYMVGEKIDGYTIRYIDHSKVILKNKQLGYKKVLPFENETGETFENNK